MVPYKRRKEMTKSQLIRDIAEDNISLESALYRWYLV